MHEPEFALYVSSVEGHAVTRFSSHKMGRRPLLIGATRDHKDPTKITWDTSRIVPIPEGEYARFGREYNREIRAGGLKKRSAEEYAEWVNKQVKAEAPNRVDEVVS